LEVNEKILAPPVKKNTPCVQFLVTGLNQEQIKSGGLWTRVNCLGLRLILLKKIVIDEGVS